MKKFKALLGDVGLKQKLFFMACVIIIFSLITYYFFGNTKVIKSKAPPPEVFRDYSRVPFNLSDAYEQCVAETKEQLGENMLRYTMDNLSTFLDPKTKVYFVVLKVDVGSIIEFREASIYCNVDPTLHVVTYYKEVYPGESRSILSRTIEFFSGD